MCAQGSKMVVLITGLCSAHCYYCPLSFEKGQKDIIYADEWKLNNENDTKKLIREAEYITAKGAGITGGDPLLVWERTQKYIILLKDTFGSDFHIHLYTSGLIHTNKISSLISAGLDEIRFHPSPQYWNCMNTSPYAQVIRKSVDESIDVAIEIPVIPTMENEIIQMIQWADTNQLQWVNLNELEFSERNVQALMSKGYEVKDELSAAVQNSQETALNVISQIQQQKLEIGVHYCSVSFKDGIQLQNRIKRRAQKIAKEYEVITKDGTLLKGIIIPTNITLKELYRSIQQTYHISKKYIHMNTEKNRLEIGAWILEKIADNITRQGHACYMIEEYPTADRLEVEKIPLPLD
ncbi:MAG: radical SAM protein [Thermoplasmatota archaeon]